jgi:hypothetical protein
VTTTKHSRIGPSRSQLIMHCAGSVQAEDAAGRPPAGEAAERGTELHAVAEEDLRNGTKSTDPIVAAYVDEVRATAMRAGVAPLIEQRLDLSKYHPELFGTLDSAIVDLAWGVLTVNDFKSGLLHVPADALQLKLYGGMAYLSLPPADQRRIKWIDTVVVQPNGSANPVRRLRHSVAGILNALSDYIDQAHIATDDPDPPRTAGPWCRSHFCAARASCPAFRTLALSEAQNEFTATEEGGERSE